ncbi:hypothetical protein BDR26DRAFT_93100 [Obelidium mucronatum]|nr:hypothetical protein BDR26DRAFT_93100 [Obelidium mucronatum]
MEETEAIDTSYVYALHTFVANVEGQVCVLKGDSLKLLDDTNYYWWLVKCVKTEEIGYIPAENIETPSERLARLNKFKNVQETLVNATDAAEPPATVDPSKPRLVFADSAIVFENYDDIDYDDDDEEDGEEEEAGGGALGGAGTSVATTTASGGPSGAGSAAAGNGGAAGTGAGGNLQPKEDDSGAKGKRTSIALGTGFLKKLWKKDSVNSPASPATDSKPAQKAEPSKSINVLRIYTGNVDLKATYKAVALMPDMTTAQLLDVALKRFRVEGESASNYFLSVLFMDSGEKPLEPTAIVFNALEALKNKNLPGVANFNKIEGKAKTSVMMNDDNIIKVIINKRLNIFEKDFHLIRVYQLDVNDPTGKARTYKTIGVKLNAVMDEVTEIVKEKFKVSNDIKLKHYLCTKLKTEAQEKRRGPEEKIVDILATKNGEPVEVEFILRQEAASPETIRKRELAAKNTPAISTSENAATKPGTLSFLDGGDGSNRPTSVGGSPAIASSVDGDEGSERASSVVAYSEDVEPSFSERGSITDDRSSTGVRTGDERSRVQSNQSNRWKLRFG